MKSMFSKIAAFLIVAAAALFSVPAMAAGSSVGVIDSMIAVTSSSFVLVHSSGSASGQPGCATSVRWWALDTSTATGKSQYAMVLVAYSLGKTITFAGDGNCTLVSGAENLAGVSL